LTETLPQPKFAGDGWSEDFVDLTDAVTAIDSAALANEVTWSSDRHRGMVDQATERM
jgi:hypothetical protein